MPKNAEPTAPKKQNGFFQWRPHPWHGIPIAAEPPSRVNADYEEHFT